MSLIRFSILPICLAFASCSPLQNTTDKKSNIDRNIIINEGYLNLIENNPHHRVVAHSLVVEFLEAEKAQPNHITQLNDKAWDKLLEYEILGIKKGLYMAKVKGAWNKNGFNGKPLYSSNHNQFFTFYFGYDGNQNNKFGMYLSGFASTDKHWHTIKKKHRILPKVDAGTRLLLK